MTREQFADEYGVTYGTLSHWLRVGNIPYRPLDNLCQKIRGVDAMWIIRGDRGALSEDMRSRLDAAVHLLENS